MPAVAGPADQRALGHDRPGARPTGTEAEKALAFKDTYAALHRRLAAFVALPIDALDRISLQHRLDAIGQGEAHADTVSG